MPNQDRMGQGIKAMSSNAKGKNVIYIEFIQN